MRRLVLQARFLPWTLASSWRSFKDIIGHLEQSRAPLPSRRRDRSRYRMGDSGRSHRAARPSDADRRSHPRSQHGGQRPMDPRSKPRRASRAVGPQHARGLRGPAFPADGRHAAKVAWRSDGGLWIRIQSGELSGDAAERHEATALHGAAAPARLARRHPRLRRDPDLRDRPAPGARVVQRSSHRTRNRRRVCRKDRPTTGR